MASRFKKVEAKEVLYSVGDQAKFSYIILQGSIEQYKENPLTKKRTKKKDQQQSIG